VGVKSEVGKGSTFHAVLPRLPGGARPAPSSASPTVLVVEDDAKHRARIVEALTAAGYGVEAATTGEQALQKSLARAFDAVTLDLLLPDMSGAQVLRGLRKEKGEGEPPVIVVTAKDERGALAGFAVHDILPKPIDERELRASLARAGVPPDKGAVLVVDDDSRSLDLMAAMLGRLGYRSRCASSGRVALESARGAPPAAVVLDLIMPGMDGLELLERFRQVPRCRRVPVIIWTVKDLSPAERTRLRDAAQGQSIAKRRPDVGANVVAELEAFLGPATSRPRRVTSERAVGSAAREG
jgi:CheY-like chemotaxis protein